MSTPPRLHIVHCIDTEGPLTEDLRDTFSRLRSIFGIDVEPTPLNLEKLQKKQINLNGSEEDVARVVAPECLAYNESWSDIRDMLTDALCDNFRNRMVDSRGNGWVYSWHCMDHAGYSDNPRRKDTGYGNVFRFYRDILEEFHCEFDEINWHFHPLSFSRNPLQCATSYVNSYDVLNQILCRRMIDENWFPVTNRPGFHTERPDIHAFLEQWIPFDYANQYYEGSDDGQPDLVGGRFGDWRRAPATWRGYQPSHDDYQTPGMCRRWVFRCLNVGTRFNTATHEHLAQAFREADDQGSAIFAVANHDYRDIRPDVEYVRKMIAEVHPGFPGVDICFSGATAAARSVTNGRTNRLEQDLELQTTYESPRFVVKVTQGAIFGPQPYLAIKTRDGIYYHDNFDVHKPGEIWTYTFDDHTLPANALDVVVAGAASPSGSTRVSRVKF